MSFLSVLGKIGHVVVAGTAAIAPFAPLIETIPGVGTIFGTVFQGIMIAEQLVSTTASGTQKKQLATAVVNSVHPGLNQDALGQSIDAIVALLNQLAAAASKVPVPAT